jgi:hypothetical protein
MPVEVRAQLTDALRLDLVGSGEVFDADDRVLGDASEILPQRQRLRNRAKDLLDEWSRIAMDQKNVGGQLQYQIKAGAAQRLLHEFLNPALTQQPPRFQKFRANRAPCVTWNRV